MSKQGTVNSHVVIDDTLLHGVSPFRPHRTFMTSGNFADVDVDDDSVKSGDRNKAIISWYFTLAHGMWCKSLFLESSADLDLLAELAHNLGE